MRSFLKRALAQASLRTGLFHHLLGERGVIVAFHRIDDRYPTNSLSYSLRGFRDLCRLFRTHFDVVPLPELLDALDRGDSMSARLAITFDDGYLDNHRTAAPILEEFRLPATFFVTTGFIGTRHQAWWDVEAGIESEWMDWPDLVDLHERGFDIGAHTVNHVDLGTVHGEEARRELVDSKSTLEEILGSPVDLFAYPYGRPAEFSEANRELVREIGFRCSPSCYGGVVRAGDDPFRLRRTPISPWYESASQFALDLLRE